jgi:hypothetical protein
MAEDLVLPKTTVISRWSAVWRMETTLEKGVASLGINVSLQISPSVLYVIESPTVYRRAKLSTAVKLFGAKAGPNTGCPTDQEFVGY